MITETEFASAIETFRMHKAYMTCLHGNMNEDYIDNLVQEIYNGLLCSFIKATVHPELSAYFELYDSLDEDYVAFCAFDTLNDFIDFGYTYTAELDSAPEDIHDEWYRQPVPLVSSEGILLDNIHDFYNYWVSFQTPENPVYKEVSFSSKDSSAIAQHYIAEVRKRCFPDKYFII